MDHSIFWYEENILYVDLFEKKENLIGSVLALNYVMKKYDTYDKRLIHEILKYNAICNCGLDFTNNKLNTLCYKCETIYKNIKREKNKKFNKNLFYITAIFIILLFVFIITMTLTFNPLSF